jgi:hypothetical protein
MASNKARCLQRVTTIERWYRCHSGANGYWVNDICRRSCGLRRSSCSPAAGNRSVGSIRKAPDHLWCGFHYMACRWLIRWDHTSLQSIDWPQSIDFDQTAHIHKILEHLSLPLNYRFYKLTSHSLGKMIRLLVMYDLSYASPEVYVSTLWGNVLLVIIFYHAFHTSTPNSILITAKPCTLECNIYKFLNIKRSYILWTLRQSLFLLLLFLFLKRGSFSGSPCLIWPSRRD